MGLSNALEGLNADLNRMTATKVVGRVSAIQGMLVEIGGVANHLSIGDRCNLVARGNQRIRCEVVGFRDGMALAMPYGPLQGVGQGCDAELIDSEPVVRPHDGWLGRVINAFGEPLDGGVPLPIGEHPYPVRNQPPPAHARNRLGGKIDLGVRCLNTFTTCCLGQRIGIFSGSGVGQSILVSMMSRCCSAVVIVIGLVGERAREVQGCIQEVLGLAGVARSVAVVAT